MAPESKVDHRFDPNRACAFMPTFDENSSRRSALPKQNGLSLNKSCWSILLNSSLRLVCYILFSLTGAQISQITYVSNYGLVEDK